MMDEVEQEAGLAGGPAILSSPRSAGGREDVHS